MRKTYNYKNATIHVLNVDNYDRENLKKATEKFLKKIIKRGTNKWLQ